jgi:hypothetical protein
MATIPSIAMIPSGYKASKVYSVLPTDGTGDLTFSRASSATRVNSDGLIEEVLSNVPRLDYSDGGCPSLLIEPQSTNLVTYSEDFSNVSWSKSNSTVSSNSIISPDGNLTADKLVEDSTTNRHFVSKGGVPIGQSILSVFAKQGERKNIGIGNASEAAYAVFDLSNGTLVSVSSLGGVLSNAKIQSIGNGWYRISVENNRASGSGFGIITANDLGQVSYLGDGTSGVYIWGAQLEALPYATSYIPTVASTVTRVAESVSKTGISDLIGQTEGTLFAEVNMSNWESGNRVLAISDGTTNNRVIILINTSRRFRAISAEGGTIQVDLNSTTQSDGVHKIAFTYAENDFAFYVDGIQIGIDTSALVPACSNFYVGKIESSSDGQYFNNLISQALLFKTRLSNVELATLTTL